jgi:Ca2+-dependent lipid-binding protein
MSEIGVFVLDTVVSKVVEKKKDDSNIRAFVYIKVVSASDLIAVDSNGKSDPYCIITKVASKDNTKFKTKTKKKVLNYFKSIQL